MTADSLRLSEVQDLEVVDAAGREIGRVVDVVADPLPEPPLVQAFIVARDDEQVRVRWSQVGEIDIDGEQLRLTVSLDDLDPASLRGDEIALVDSILDNRVLDVPRRKLVRVQDVLLGFAGGALTVNGIDVSSGAVLRRIGLSFLVGRRRGPGEEDFVAWDNVNLIPLRLSRPNFLEAFSEVAELHPADIADILNQVGPRERAAVLGALDPPVAADTLQEMDEALRAPALIEMPIECAVAILGELDPDEAVDILADAPRDAAEGLLGRLPQDEAAELRDLATHAEHSAGGLMTTDFVTVDRDTTAAAALDAIRVDKPPSGALAYVYVVDEEGLLCGVVSLRDLVLAQPGQRLREFMEEEVVRVAADVDREEVGRLMTKYNLLALPVTDDEGRVLGIVTLDDALDAIVPDEWKQRLPRLFG